MKRVKLTLLFLSLFAAAAARGEMAPIPADASVDQILSSLQDRGNSMQSFTSDVVLTKIDDTTGDSTADIGNVVFQKLDSGEQRIRVTFTKHQEGDKKPYSARHEYTLSNGWLIDRDYYTKKEDRKQVLRPGEKINLLKLGEGPFPLPIGQDPAVVKANFEVTKAAAALDDPPATLHLQLSPKPASDFARKFKQIDFWIDRSTGMPRLIKTVDTQGLAQKTDLTNLHLNARLSDSDFQLPPVTGWNVVEEPFAQ